MKYGDKWWVSGGIAALIVIGQSLSQMETIQMIYCFTNTDIDNQSSKVKLPLLLLDASSQ